MKLEEAQSVQAPSASVETAVNMQPEPQREAADGQRRKKKKKHKAGRGQLSGGAADAEASGHGAALSGPQEHSQGVGGGRSPGELQAPQQQQGTAAAEPTAGVEEEVHAADVSAEPRRKPRKLVQAQQQPGAPEAARSAAKGSHEPAAVPAMAHGSSSSSGKAGKSHARSPGKGSRIGRDGVQGKGRESEPGHAQPPAVLPVSSSQGARLPNGHAGTPAKRKNKASTHQAVVREEQPSSNGPQVGHSGVGEKPQKKKRLQPVAANGDA